MKKILCAFAVAALCLVACKQQSEPVDNHTKSGLDPADFVADVDGVQTGLYTLTNSHGMEVCITNFGGRIVSIVIPDRDSVLRDVVLGFDNIQDYMTVPSDFGATIGRYANRIANGRFTLDRKVYELPQNNNGHTLHGGPQGWQYKPFTVVDHSENSLQLLTEVLPVLDEALDRLILLFRLFPLGGQAALGVLCCLHGLVPLPDRVLQLARRHVLDVVRLHELLPLFHRGQCEKR